MRCARPFASTDRKQSSTSSISEYRLLAATNFEFVAIRVFEKERVVARAVLRTNLRSLEIFPASVAHQVGKAIHLFARVRPKGYARVIRTMLFVLVQTKKFGDRSVPPA